ncbi:MAG: hypothetical protein L3J98_14925 [Gammaproteobacteria bacterium]|nr:hypothetical protein [Gammaproteobacteria bacterium]
MNNNVNRNPFIAISSVTFLVFTVFALSTSSNSFGLMSRDEMGWRIGRFISVGLWLLLAYVLHKRRHKYFSRDSFIYATVAAGGLSFVFSAIWGGLGGTVIFYGSAVFYTLISGLLCSSLGDYRKAAILSFGFILIQVIADMIFLGIVGDFKIH